MSLADNRRNEPCGSLQRPNVPSDQAVHFHKLALMASTLDHAMKNRPRFTRSPRSSAQCGGKFPVCAGAAREHCRTELVIVAVLLTLSVFGVWSSANADVVPEGGYPPVPFLRRTSRQANVRSASRK